MPTTSNLRDALVEELRDCYDAEKQLVKALPKLAAAATSADLEAAFSSHLDETREHVNRLEQVFGILDQPPRGKHCDGIAGIIKEGSSTIEDEDGGPTMDACLIAAGQRAEHYEMAAYGTLIAWAKQLGLDDAVPLLEQTLDEEEAADRKLSSLGEGGINQSAAENTAMNGSSNGSGKRQSARGDEDEAENDSEMDENDNEDESTGSAGARMAMSRAASNSSGRSRTKSSGARGSSSRSSSSQRSARGGGSRKSSSSRQGRGGSKKRR